MEAELHRAWYFKKIEINIFRFHFFLENILGVRYYLDLPVCQISIIFLLQFGRGERQICRSGLMNNAQIQKN